MNFWGYVFCVALLAGGYFWLGATALAAFFVVGGWPLWGLLVVAVVAAAVIEEKYDHGALAFIPFGVFCLVVHFVSQFNLLDWGRENLGYIATRAGVYLALGFSYSMFRWVLHLNKMAGEVDVLEKDFRRNVPYEGSLDKASVAVRLKFAEFLKRSTEYNPDLPGEGRRDYDPREHGIQPQFGRNVLTNFRRFWWWPFSAVGWFANDLFREIWEGIKNLMQKVADGFGGLIFGKRANYVVTEAEAEEYHRNRQDPPSAGGLDEDDDSSLGELSPAPRRTT